PPLHPGWKLTTLSVATAHSVDYLPPAACNQPPGRVHLGGGRFPWVHGMRRWRRRTDESHVYPNSRAHVVKNSRTGASSSGASGISTSSKRWMVRIICASTP